MEIDKIEINSDSEFSPDCTSNDTCGVTTGSEALASDAAPESSVARKSFAVRSDTQGSVITAGDDSRKGVVVHSTSDDSRKRVVTPYPKQYIRWKFMKNIKSNSSKEDFQTQRRFQKMNIKENRTQCSLVNLNYITIYESICKEKNHQPVTRTKKF